MQILRYMMAIGCHRDVQYLNWNTKHKYHFIYLYT
jgi:hypothetical protein